jgi:UDPglucose 6-dehydrogenase
MKISIVGAGYVGLATGVGFASMGHSVICVDVDAERVRKLNRGEPPIYEPMLEEHLRRALEENRFEATTELGRAIRQSEVIFICVGTPSKSDGSMDPVFIEQASRDIGQAMRDRGGYPVVAVKSTVVPGTTEGVVIPLLERNSGKRAGAGFGVCVNPEFLREGQALSDFFNPDRVIIGELDGRSGDTLHQLYRDFKCPILRTDLRTAEMIKYASNAFLAAKISFINEIGNICKRLGIDVYEVARGMGLDRRISSHFLNAGIGFGGSCFPKDVRALMARARELGYEPRLLEAVMALNEDQPLRLLELLRKHLPHLRGRRIGVLGLAFKPGTDDVREAPSIRIVGELLREGAAVKAYDPKAMDNFRRIFPQLQYCGRAEEVLDSDAVLILTEWEEFRRLDYSGKVVIDGRRIEEARKARVYEGVCW